MDLLYIVIVTGSCFFTTCGLIYAFDKEMAISLSRKIGWNVLKGYTYCEEIYENQIVDVFYKQEEEAEDQYLGYNLEENESIIMFEKPEKDYDIIFLIKKNGKKTYYKRLEEGGDEEVKTVDKQFLQIEIEMGGQKKEIQSFLKYFYVEGNVFDPTFFKWYMKYWYSTDLKEDYCLHIIDNSINVFLIDSKQKIVLEDNKYVVKDI